MFGHCESHCKRQKLKLRGLLSASKDSFNSKISTQFMFGHLKKITINHPLVINENTSATKAHFTVISQV